MTQELKLPLVRVSRVKVGCAGARTVTVKVCVALRLGVPLSNTITPRVLVEPLCAMAGRQVKTPVPELMDAPAGGVGDDSSV